MENLEAIETELKKGDALEAIRRLDILIAHTHSTSDKPYYLRGNAYRRLGNWQMALNNYLEAIERNPRSPALHARQMVMDILNFYNKDMYNQ